MTTTTFNGAAVRRPASVGVPSVRSLAALAGAWFERMRSRDSLARMDDRLLADIGLTRAEAEAEASRPFWS
jgi:uncharacterized protein YjiS (DUF1127 family)